jgi:glycosyltransferase involved in cell wall biosynthesis
MLTDPMGSLKLKFDKWWIKFFIEDILNYFLALLPKKVLFCSRDIMESCRRILFFSRKKIFQLPYPLDVSLFTPGNKIGLRNKLKIPKNQKTIIFVGRIEYNKGADIILKLAEKNPDILFILIGKLSPRIDIAPLKNLRLLPAVSSQNLSDYYSAADLCLFPSRAEAFGLVPREAMACGTPAIVSDITSLRLIGPAIKVPLDSEEIDKEIKKFFNLSKKEKENLSKISRDFIIGECSLEVCKDLYSSILLN